MEKQKRQLFPRAAAKSGKTGVGVLCPLTGRAVRLIGETSPAVIADGRLI